MSQEDACPTRRTAASILKRVAVTLFVAALLAWVLRQAWLEAGAINWRELQMRPGLIALSILLTLIAWVLHGALWAVMIRGLGYDLSLVGGIRGNLIGNLGNYIPGKIFIIVLRAKIVACEGVPWMIVASSVVLETLLRNIVAALLAALGVWYLGVGGSYAGALALAVILSAIVVHPAVFNPLTDFVLRKMKRPPLPRHLRLGQVLALLGGYAVYWAIYAVAFWLLAAGTLNTDFTQLPGLAVSLFLSMIASMLAVFAPVGLGVADATMAGVLAQTSVMAAPAVLAVIARVWRTLMEVATAGICWLLPGGVGGEVSGTTDGDEPACPGR